MGCALPDPGRRGPARQRARTPQGAMDQRTRERLPALPVLAAAVGEERAASAARLAAASAAGPGEYFTAGGQTLRRSVMSSKGSARVWADEPGTGKRRDLTLEDHRGFWAWAAVEVLRHTGIRIEELTELSHHSLVQYRLPATGELSRCCRSPRPKPTPSGCWSSARSWPTCSAPSSPGSGATRTAFPWWLPTTTTSASGTRRCRCCSSAACAQKTARSPPRPSASCSTSPWPAPALTDAAGEPLRFAPHDFRRMLITDAIMHGMRPHIAQLVAGHRDINTTMGYKAVYPEEVINGHRAFIARRRALAPARNTAPPPTPNGRSSSAISSAAGSLSATAAAPTGPAASTSTAASAVPSCGPTQPSGPASPASATTCATASPRPSSTPGPAKPKAQSQPRRRHRQAHPDGRTRRPPGHRRGPGHAAFTQTASRTITAPAILPPGSKPDRRPPYRSSRHRPGHRNSMII